MKKFFVPINVAEKRLDSIEDKIAAWKLAGLSDDEIDKKIETETLAAIQLTDKAIMPAPGNQSRK